MTPATMIPFPLSEVERARRDLERAATGVREALAETTSVSDAYAYFRELRQMEALLLELTTYAMARCGELES